MNLLTVPILAAVLATGTAYASDAGLLQLPESAGWQHGRAFVTAYNQGDPAALADFLSARLGPRARAQESVDARVQQLLKLRQEVGPAEVLEVSGTPAALILNLAGANGDADVVLIVDTARPNRLEELRAVANRGSGQASSSRVPRNGGAL